MLKSLLKGVGMGAGMGIGQELTGTLIQHVRNRSQGQGNQFNINSTGAERDIQCGGCGAINTGDSKFCGSCGNGLVARYNLQSGVKCVCGYMNCKGQKFCSECGKGLA